MSRQKSGEIQEQIRTQKQTNKKTCHETAMNS